ncbi:uncharacterized protein CTRU02_211323 [Colletotrichum truncatum]|uniref:Uncharacterized protein n=1 Tax=Colletotrichum truncatum TaxID=5467 RepID=A0ACC3YRL0_COLTU|nr:uncharacterized protein CTRU02_02099 [Colletotrichum truncatum]KAF6799228.1 hypothetical protein CTRU02_02099 [Colletotrichum truncatum]
MIVLKSLLVLAPFVCLGRADTGANECTLATFNGLKGLGPPKGLKKYPLPKIAGPARIDITKGISVQMTQSDPKYQGCTWKFFNSGYIQQQVWYSVSNNNWDSIWVYADSDSRSKDAGPGCEMHDNYCDSDNEGIYVGNAL